MSATLGEASLKALDWVAVNLHKFDPHINKHAQAVRAMKALAELLLIADLAPKKHPGNLVIERIIHIAATVWNDPLYRARAVRHPRLFRLYFAPLATLARCGRVLSADDHALIAQVLGTGYAQQVAEVPFREMDVDWTLARLEYPLPRPQSETVEQLISRSLIGRRLPALEFSREDTYNFTHLVFYVTDWGRVHWPLDNMGLEYVRASVTQLLGIWTCRQDWDLVGELLAVAAATNILQTCVAQAAMRQFIAAQQANGAFPLRNNAKPNFWNTYHTVLVAVILDLVAEHSSQLYSVRISGTEVDPAVLTLFTGGLNRCRQISPSSEKHSQFAELLREVLDSIPRLEMVVDQLSLVRSQSMDAVSYLPILEAVTNNDLLAIGTNLARGVTEIPPTVAFGVIGWLFARQGLDGHFGSLEPERRALKNHVDHEFEFESKVQWPATLSILAGLSVYLNSIQQEIVEGSVGLQRSSKVIHP